MTDLPEGPNLESLMAHDEGCGRQTIDCSNGQIVASGPCDCTREARLRSALSDLIEQNKTFDGENDELRERLALSDLRVRQLEQDVARTAELEKAIRWALGEGDSDFGTTLPEGRAPDDGLSPRIGRYWWRSELRRRAFGEAPLVSSTPDEKEPK